jgi:NaMN:DMB phosphoribosyltransferase
VVPDGIKSPVQNIFRDRDRERLQALLKPVSQVRILPGALQGLYVATLPSAIHRLFIVYGAIQHVRDSGVDAAPPPEDSPGPFSFWMDTRFDTLARLAS